MMIYIWMMILIFLSGLISFSFNRKHLLLMLLSLEFIVLALYMNLFYFLNLGFDNFFSLLFLVMSVCESVLGLSILVFCIRMNGNDHMMTYSFLW